MTRRPLTPRRRRRRLALAGAVALPVLTLWFATRWWTVQGTWTGPRGSAQVRVMAARGGVLGVWRLTPTYTPPAPWLERNPRPGWAWRFDAIQRTGTTALFVPLWIVWAPALGVGAWAWWRRPPVQACPACGYSLAGLPAERCPECGQRVPSRA